MTGPTSTFGNDTSRGGEPVVPIMLAPGVPAFGCRRAHLGVDPPTRIACHTVGRLIPCDGAATAPANRPTDFFRRSASERNGSAASGAYDDYGFHAARAEVLPQ